MNVYDLDGTILKGDSEDYFFKYCFSKLNISKKAKRKFKFYGFLLMFGLMKPARARAKQYYFLREIDNIDEVLERFWDEHIQYIYPYYLKYKKDDDVISTASPTFIELPLFKRLGITNYIGSEMDKKTGHLIDTFLNYGTHKLDNFKAKYPDAEVDKFFSDSYSDYPLASIAKNYYKIVDGKISEWNNIKMRNLFNIDANNYDLNGKWKVRPSVRALIIKDGKIALTYSKKYNYYKIPGGGIDGKEFPKEALVREVKEETGLTVIEKTIKEYGYVYMIVKGIYEDVFMQNNYYYFCDVQDEIVPKKLEEYELEEQFELVFVDPKVAIEVNNKYGGGFEQKEVAIREAKVLQMLIDEGKIKAEN